MKKKISLVLSIILAFTFLTFGNGTSARAEDKDAVIGTSNLNNTPDNSAKFGEQLLQPEKGWKRYDDNKDKILYSANWKYRADSGPKYNRTDHVSTTVNDYLAFRFYGNKLRILSQINSSNSKEVTIILDGKEFTTSAIKGSTDLNCCIIFESLELDNKAHEVKIINKGAWVDLDAIDIDENGKLLLPDEVLVESITLDKSSISLLEEKNEKLTATVKPDNATNKKVTWSSSDKDIATVDENGNVTAAKKVGHATITAKVDGTDLKATCDVNVTELNKNRAILAITMVNGITKEYDVSADEIESFEKWFDASNGKGQLRYGFNKTIKPYKTVKEYVVFDKIASFEVREYEADK